MVNVNMLKAKIIEKNIEKKKIAECLGISPPSPPRRHGLHIVRDDFFISKKSSAHSFRRSSSPQKAYAFRGPRYLFLL